MNTLRDDRSELTILYVEDEEITRIEFGRTLFKKYPDLAIHAADNGATGLALFKQLRPDITITDINMPVMDGMGMVREIRRINPDAVIVALSAFSDTKYLLDAIELGITNYVLKPVNYRTFFAIIDKCIDDVRTKQKLREQNEHIRKLSRAVEQSPSTVMITTKTGAIEYVNPKFTEIAGYAAEEVIGRNPNILKSGLTSGETYEQLWRSLNSGQEWHGEFVNKKKSGELYWESASISPIIDEEGTVTHYVAVKEDITLRKQLDIALQKSTETMRALIQASPVAIVLLDTSGRVIVWSPAAQQLFGWDSSEVIGHHLPTIDNAVAQERRKLTTRIRDGLIVNGLEISQFRKDGTSVEVALWSAPLRDAGGAIIGTADFLIDITEQKQAEATITSLNQSLQAYAEDLQAANRELSSFNYMVTHDLRQPLTNISGFAQLIMQVHGDTLTGESRRWLQEIADQASNMKQLIETLLNFSSISTAAPERKPVDLTALARAITADLEKQERDRVVTVAIADGLATHGDERLLRILLGNLLGNSWKYTRSRRDAMIEFGTTVQESRSVFFVRDNGIGFDNAEASRLFVPFTRLEGTEEYAGHGIGLATVNKIVRHHGGAIWAEGVQGKGATFFFTLEPDSTRPA